MQLTCLLLSSNSIYGLMFSTGFQDRLLADNRAANTTQHCVKNSRSTAAQPLALSAYIIRSKRVPGKTWIVEQFFVNNRFPAAFESCLGC